MSSLFVSEDSEEHKVKIEGEDGRMSIDSHVDAEIKGEMEVTMDRDNVKIKTEPTESEDKGSLSFYEDEDEDSEDEDDPVIDTIPVHLNVTNTKLSPLLLQFPTKSSQSISNQNNISALHRLQIKHESGVVELRLPLNTENFFSNTTAEKYNISEQFLRGVIIHDEPMGTLKEGTIHSNSVLLNKAEKEVQVKQEKKTSFIKSHDDNSNSNLSTIRAQPGSVGGSRYLVGVQDSEGRLHVTPISDTCMLRPHFSYIDNIKLSKIERERELQKELNNNNEKNGNGKEVEKKNASVVTMSAKSTKENVPRLGGALLSAKLESEEEGKEYQIIPCNEETIHAQFTESSGNVLRTKLTQEEYLELLLRQTMV